MNVKTLVNILIQSKGSDLHLKAGRPPLFRVGGNLLPAKLPTLSAEEVGAMVLELCSPLQSKALERCRYIDFSFQIPELGRLRCNAYFQKGTLGAAIRMIPNAIPTFEELRVPVVLKELVQKQRGLILITGATGSGKSTTLAALLQHINETRHVHILTIEDPIEFIYEDQKAVVTQREVGSDALNFQDALIAGMRQDPDVIVIGEMRNPETIAAALTAAETGHLVISTLHTNDSKSTLNRILDTFKDEAQNQIRVQLSASLLAIVSQQLILGEESKKRFLASEVMIKSPLIENYILNREFDRISEAISTSTDYYKMQNMNQALYELVASKAISLEEAVRFSSSPDDLRLKFTGMSH